MDIKIWLALLIAGAIVTAIAVLAVKDRKKRKTISYVGAGILVLALLVGLVSPNYAYNTDLGGFTNLAVAPRMVITPPTPTMPVPGCAVESTTVAVSATNKHTSAATGESHLYRINGAPARTVANAGTFTASPGDRVEIMFMGGNTSSAYYSDIKSYTVPCVGTKDFYTNVIANGTLTIDLFNRDGDRMNSGVANQTIGAGQTFTLNLRLTAPNDAGYLHGGIMVVEFNNTEVRDMTIQTKQGGTLKTNNPNFYTVSNTANVFRTFNIQALEDNAELDLNLIVEASTSVNPAGMDGFTIRFYPKNPFVNARTGGSFNAPAVEDEDDDQTYGYVELITAYLA